MNYTATDRRILAFLRYDGRATAGLLADELDRSRAQITRRLLTLRQVEEIRYRHEPTGLYDLA